MRRMRLGARRSESAMPRTVMGRYLRAYLSRDAATRQKLSAKLNGGKLGFNPDEAAVVQAACELAVRRLWGTNYDVRQIAEAVAFMREANLDRGTTPYGQLEMETVIRSALGEADVDISGMPRTLAFEIQIAVMSYPVGMLSMQESEVVRLVVDAERIAVDSGWKPPLAQNGKFSR